MRPLPGAAELLAGTAGLGLQVVLATSAKDDEMDLMLDALGAGDAISTVVSSGAVEHAKPAPGPGRPGPERVRQRPRALGHRGMPCGTCSRPGEASPASACSAGGTAAEQLQDASAVHRRPGRAPGEPARERDRPGDGRRS